MEPASTIHSTFILERTYPATLAEIFAAFTDPAIKRRWFAESPNHTVEAFVTEARSGGSERTAYRFHPGGPLGEALLTSEGIYLDVEPEQRIVIASTMAVNGAPISTAMVTFEFLPTPKGTVVICTHQGAFFENADGPELREAGWRQLLDRLGEVLV
jgi:uncharacterized protein YndB with AHSA1/START domain